MPKFLAQSDIQKFRDKGYCSPITVMSPEEAAGFLDRLDRAAASHEAAEGVLKIKSHLVFACLYELVHRPAVVDAIEDLLGPDILAWTSSIFAKGPADPSYVSWHQDVVYWGLEPPKVVTAWLALTDSTPENGCMRVMPGSHLRPVEAHRDTYAQHNLLSRGQEIATSLDEARAVDMVLQPGQMSLHHVKLAHASAPNASTRRRLGFAVRYISAEVRQIRGETDSATLVRGSDTGSHFEHEPRPTAEFDEGRLELHAAIVARSAKFLFDDAG